LRALTHRGAEGLEGGLQVCFAAKGEAEEEIDTAIAWCRGQVCPRGLFGLLEAMGGEQVVYLLLFR
jgi:hypothetical protein